MKPLHIGLLAFCVAAVIGIGLIATHEPKPQAVTPPVPKTAAPASEIASSPAPQLTTAPKAHRKPKAKQLAARPQATSHQQLFPLTIGDGQSGGIFSGADPEDPRIYHFTDLGQ